MNNKSIEYGAIHKWVREHKSIPDLHQLKKKRVNFLRYF